MTQNTRRGAAPRHRVTVARAVLKRIAHQRRRLSTDVAAARTDRQRLMVLCDALRAASAPGRHQPPGQDLQLGSALSALRSALEALHQVQEQHAQRVLDTEAARARRRQRKEDAA